MQPEYEALVFLLEDRAKHGDNSSSAAAKRHLAAVSERYGESAAIADTIRRGSELANAGQAPPSSLSGNAEAPILDDALPVQD